MIHPALRYLVRTRLRNRVRRWLARLRTVTGLLGALLVGGMVAGMALGGAWGASLPVAERAAVFVTILGFLLVMGVLGGLGQRGLVYSAADLDFLFPGPFRRRHLILYQFAPHYLAAAVMGLFYVFVFGGRLLPHPAFFLLGAFLAQVVNTHLATAAAELSMLLADTVFARMRHVVVALLILVTLAATFLLVAGLSGWGDVPGHLEGILDSEFARVLLFPAMKAVEMGVAPDLVGRLAALAALLLCVGASFALVLAIPVDVLEGSFTTSVNAHQRMRQARRGQRPARVTASARGPRGPLVGGAGAVLWLNALTLRRQLRAAVGGLFVVLLMFALLGMRSSGQGGVGATMLGLLAGVPLWMPLPVGFRLPREQLAELKRLPLAPGRLALALLVIPVLAPFALQLLGVGVLAGSRQIPPAVALAVLPAYLAAAAGLLAVEGMFVLRRPQPQAVDVLSAFVQILAQVAALLPALIVLGAVLALAGGLASALVAAAACQALVDAALLASLGRRFQRRDLEQGGD